MSGLKLDRDHNAAINVLRLGQGLTFVERKPLFVSTTNVKRNSWNKQVIIDEARSP